MAHPRKRRQNERPPKRRKKALEAEAPTISASGKPASVPRRVILVKWPTRSRPAKFFDVLDRYRGMESGKHEVRYLISCDIDDPTMNNDEVHRRLSKIPGLSVRYGNSTTKIEAFNIDVDDADVGYTTPWEILIATSDDMVPAMNNWDNFVACEMEGEDAVWFYDGRSKNCCTLSIMSRKKYEQQGYIYHPAYKSLFCDNEWTLTAEPRFVPQVVIRHVWPGRAGRDKLLTRNNAYWSEDEATFNDRRKKGFPR